MLFSSWEDVCVMALVFVKSLVHDVQLGREALCDLSLDNLSQHLLVEFGIWSRRCGLLEMLVDKLPDPLKRFDIGNL
jgi:hypothetical protein